MATVIFYEKSGCSGNARQKALLEAAGHDIVARDLRQVKWTRARLLVFFDGLPVAHWFNRNAPAVKSGDIVPGDIDEATALGLMQHDPLLIRRPLLEVGEERMVGFDVAAVDAWLGLGVLAHGLQETSLEACSHADPAHRCHDPLVD
ncbi:MAG: ArsC/Spx/MgsR family protein [Sulfurisoma sp.]|nr:ArsC/Spx/MgsR family protein [Sulfurisoma sp.]